MPCCKNDGKVEAVVSARLRWAPRGLSGLLVLLLTLWWSVGVLFATPARATELVSPLNAGIEVHEVRLERGEDQLMLSAAIHLELPPLVVDAAEKGIPLYFVAEASVLKKRWYWYDKHVSTALRYYRLAYQPLTRRWRLQVSNAPINYSGLGVTLGQSFDELHDALAAVRRIADWKIAPVKDVALDGKEELSFSFKLDVSQLPRPFQFGVSDRPDWNLSASQTLTLTAESVR